MGFVHIFICFYDYGTKFLYPQKLRMRQGVRRLHLDFLGKHVVVYCKARKEKKGETEKNARKD